MNKEKLLKILDKRLDTHESEIKYHREELKNPKSNYAYHFYNLEYYEAGAEELFQIIKIIKEF